MVYDFTTRLAVCTSCGETQTDKSQQEGARAKTLTLFRPSTGTSTSVDPDELALAHDRQTLPCLTSGSNIRTATVVVLDVSTSMGTDYSRLEAVDSEDYDRSEVRVAGLRYDDPDPKATAKAALPKSVQPLVKGMTLLKLKADDARGAKGSFGGTVFVDLGSVAAARPFLARVSVSACLRVPALRRYEAAKDFFAENKEVLGFVGYLAFLVLFSVVVNENAHGEDYLRHNQAVRAALSEQEWNFGDLTSE